MDTEEKEVTTKDLLNFMSSFKNSIEGKIKENNDKLDDRLDKMSEKIDKNEEEAKQAQVRMEARLLLLEEEMKKNLKRREERRRFLMKNVGQNEGKVTEKEKLREDKELDKEATMDKEVTEEDTTAQLKKKPSYQSSWALSMEKELEEAARQGKDNWTNSASWKVQEGGDFTARKEKDAINCQEEGE